MSTSMRCLYLKVLMRTTEPSTLRRGWRSPAQVLGHGLCPRGDGQPDGRNRAVSPRNYERCCTATARAPAQIPGVSLCGNTQNRASLLHRYRGSQSPHPHGLAASTAAVLRSTPHSTCAHTRAESAYGDSLSDFREASAVVPRQTRVRGPYGLR